MGIQYTLNMEQSALKRYVNYQNSPHTLYFCLDNKNQNNKKQHSAEYFSVYMDCVSVLRGWRAVSQSGTSSLSSLRRVGSEKWLVRRQSTTDSRPQNTPRQNVVFICKQGELGPKKKVIRNTKQAPCVTISKC